MSGSLWGPFLLCWFVFILTGKLSIGIFAAIVWIIVKKMTGFVFPKNYSSSTWEYKNVSARYNQESTRQREYVFLTYLVALMTSVAKSDKLINAAEVEAIKSFFRNSLHYRGSEGKIIENLIQEAATNKLDLRSISTEIKKYMQYPELLMLVRILYSVALSDNVFKKEEQKWIEEIVGYLEIDQADYDHIKTEFSLSVVDDLYNVLEITPDATDSELKSAYRDMVMKYHPDRVAHLGKDFTDMAHEKFQIIQNAYQSIAQERNLN